MSRKPVNKPTDNDLRYTNARIKGMNQTQAAKAAGLKHPNKVAFKYEKKHRNRAIIEAHQGVEKNHALLTRTERRGLFARTVRDEEIEIPHRLTAAKLDGMCEGDFVQRLEIKSPQMEKLLGEVISILKRRVPEELFLVLAGDFAKLSETYGNNDAELS